MIIRPSILYFFTFLLALIMPAVGFSQKLDSVLSENVEMIVKNNDFKNSYFVLKGDTKPFVGIMYDLFWQTKVIEKAYYIPANNSDSCWVREYYQTGALKSEQIHLLGRSIAHGKYTQYYKNGSIEELGNYKNDLKEGKWKGFHENGDPLYECFYKQGKKHGDFKIWDVGLELTFYEVYENGVKTKKIK